jgi:hypothetical protein
MPEYPLYDDSDLKTIHSPNGNDAFDSLQKQDTRPSHTPFVFSTN